jgi:hypothetical protein
MYYRRGWLLGPGQRRLLNLVKGGMRVVKHHRWRGTIGMLKFMYTSFELCDGILEYLGSCSILAIRVLAII